jgi:hypothetical protein
MTFASFCPHGDPLASIAYARNRCKSGGRKSGLSSFSLEREIIIENENPTTLSQMTYNWAWLLLLLFSLVSIGTCLPIENVKITDQIMKPKCKARCYRLLFLESVKIINLNHFSTPAVRLSP